MKTTENDAHDGVMSTPEVSRLIGLSIVTVKRMRKLADCGGLPFVQLSPGRIGYLPSDARAFLAARRVSSAPGIDDEGGSTSKPRTERVSPSGSTHVRKRGSPNSAIRAVLHADSALP